MDPVFDSPPPLPLLFMPPDAAPGQEDRARLLAGFLVTYAFPPSNFTVLNILQDDFGPDGHGWTADQMADAINDLQVNRLIHAVYGPRGLDIIVDGLLILDVPKWDAYVPDANFRYGAVVEISEDYWDYYWSSFDEDGEPLRREFPNGTKPTTPSSDRDVSDEADFWGANPTPAWQEEIARAAHALIVADRAIYMGDLFTALYGADYRVSRNFHPILERLQDWGYIRMQGKHREAGFEVLRETWEGPKPQS